MLGLGKASSARPKNPVLCGVAVLALTLVAAAPATALVNEGDRLLPFLEPDVVQEDHNDPDWEAFAWFVVNRTHDYVTGLDPLMDPGAQLDYTRVYLEDLRQAANGMLGCLNFEETGAIGEGPTIGSAGSGVFVKTPGVGPSHSAIVGFGYWTFGLGSHVACYAQDPIGGTPWMSDGPVHSES